MSLERLHTQKLERALQFAASQFAAVLRVGIPLSDAVTLIASQTADKRLRHILTDCAQKISVGYSFSQSLTLHREIPEIFCVAVRAGEASGRLAEIFDGLYTYYEGRNAVREKVRAAMQYPVFLGILGCVVAAIVLVCLVPSMTAVLSAFGAELPNAAKILVAVSQFLTKNGWYLAAASVAVLFVLALLRRTKRCALLLSKCRLYLPLIGRITRLTAAEQFANAVSLLSFARLTLPETLRVTGRVIENRAVGARVAQTAAFVEAGSTLEQVLRKNPFFPKTLCEMAGIGESTGTLASTMQTAGAAFGKEALALRKRTLNMLEPTLIVLVGLFVAFLVFSVFIPMFSLYDAIEFPM